MLPNFFIAGAPKAGTTSLYHYLKGHPDIFMSSPKELNYFSGDEIESQQLYYKPFRVQGLKNYEGHFKDSAGEKAVGEASVSYLFYKDVPGKIFDLVPDAKIIIMLRDPARRAHSHYLMDKRLGYVSEPFEDIVMREKGIPGLDLYYQQYIELGFYHDQVKRYLDVFGKDQVRIYFFDEFNTDPDKILKDIYQFLGINEFFNTNTSEIHNARLLPVTKLTGRLYKSERLRVFFRKIAPDSLIKRLKKILFTSGNHIPLDRKLELYLKKLYDGDIKQLGGLLSREIPFWRE